MPTKAAAREARPPATEGQQGRTGARSDMRPTAASCTGREIRQPTRDSKLRPEPSRPRESFCRPPQRQGATTHGWREPAESCALSRSDMHQTPDGGKQRCSTGQRRRSHDRAKRAPTRSRRVAAATAAVICGLVGMPAAAGAETQTFAPAADARVEQAHPSSNYGASWTLRVDGATDPAVETYLRFNVTGLTGTVQSARLRLYATSNTVDRPIAFGTSTGWTEGGITWSNRPSRTVALPVSSGTVAPGAWAQFDVTPQVTGEGTYGFMLATTSTDGLNMASRESTSPRPQLVVNTTDPASPPASTAVPAISGT